MSENEKISFEEALAELEQLVSRLEKVDLNLDESVKAFERGMKLGEQAAACLNEASGKVEMLVRNMQTGSREWQQMPQNGEPTGDSSQSTAIPDGS